MRPGDPVFNEEAGLPVLLRRLDLLMREFNGPAEAIFVDDGSRDCSSVVLRQKAKDDPRFRYIGPSRNFGHQIAIAAGIEAANSDAVIVIDADLQGLPEVVLDMIARWKDGYEVVYGRRLSHECESRLKTVTASVFYKLSVRLSSVDIPRDSGDFRLIDRKAMEAFRAMPERDRFVRGMFGGLPQMGRACDDAFCLGRGERKVALQAELLVLVSWAVALPSTFRGLKIEYFIVTDPLIVIAAALLVARVLAVQTHRFAYTKRIQTFSFCTAERKP